MKRLNVLLSSILFVATAASLGAQTLPSATSRQLSVTAGGIASIAQPDYFGKWSSTAPYYPVAQSSNYPLFGVGAFVDVKFSRWIQLEAEARWLRFNQYTDIRQDNYLIGPRVPLYEMGKATLYGKGLIGFSKMNFDTYGDHGTFTTIALGGGVDYRLTKKISLRAIDFEYQDWPKWGNSSLMPYAASAGISYKIF
jgi:opacity protein-like surface antigen